MDIVEMTEKKNEADTITEYYFRVPQVAETLGTSEETVRRLLRDGKLEGVNFKGSTGWLVHEADLNGFLQANPKYPIRISPHKKLVEEKLKVLRDFLIVTDENKKTIKDILIEAIKDHPDSDPAFILDKVTKQLIKGRIDQWVY